MCTAITFQTAQHYFGRNLDLEYHYRESVVITPRKLPLHFRKEAALKEHFAFIGIATVVNNYALYYDATNEYGLSMAGLNFPGNAVYHKHRQDKKNITPFEFIPWILAQCKNVDEAEKLIRQVNLIDLPFSKDYPLTPLHWIVADKTRAMTIEPMESGITVHPNPVGVLTNNPPFDYHMHNLSNYLNLTADHPENRFAPRLNLSVYSLGMGAIGLPGDLSSASRFVRAAFTLHNSVCDHSDNASIRQFFHILGSVSQTHGCARAGDGYEKTVYTSCCNTDKGIYYYTTYNNEQITGIDMHCERLDGTQLAVYPLQYEQSITIQNRNAT